MFDVAATLERLRRAMAGAKLPDSREVRVAAVLVEDLRQYDAKQRALHLRNNPKLASLAVAQRLLFVAAEEAGEDPRLALEWLDAFDVLASLRVWDRSEAERRAVEELSVLCLVRRAVTLFKLGEYADAGELLRIVDLIGPADPETEGERLEAEALLCSVRQDLPGALARLEEASRVYRSIEDEHLVGRVFLRIAFAYAESRQPEPAIGALVEACQRIDPHRDRRLALAAGFNLARQLRDSGRIREALEALSLLAEIFARYARKVDRIHLSWLEAGLLADVGRYVQSVDAYRSVLERFSELGHSIEASEAALEAVEIFHRCGRGHELDSVLAVALLAFGRAGFAADQLAAWVALRESAARGIVTSALCAAARAAIAR